MSDCAATNNSLRICQPAVAFYADLLIGKSGASMFGTIHPVTVFLPFQRFAQTLRDTPGAPNGIDTKFLFQHVKGKGIGPIAF